MWCSVAEFLNRVTKRIAELSAQQREIQTRADRDKAGVQVQIDSLLAIQSALQKDASLEPVVLTALSLNLKIQE